MAMTREELAGKSKPDLITIAKSLEIKGTSKMSKEDLINHILLLDPPFSASPEREQEISQHLENSKFSPDSLYSQPPLPEHLTGILVHHDDSQIMIPSNYADTKIALMVRDPYWLYAYWEINQATRDHISKTVTDWEKVSLILRVYDITNVDFNGSNSNYFFDINLYQDPTNWYIHVGGPNRNFCVDLGFIQANGAFFTITRSNVVTTPRDNVSDIIDEEWMVIESDFNRLYRLSGGGLPGNSSAELIESLLKRLEREMGSGAVSSLSSPVKYQPKERKFWLILNTELIVYGATEPDAKVFIQNEPIKLRPDGSFTMRFALPDGVQKIPVTAHSADGIDTITITPIVTKETT